MPPPLGPKATHTDIKNYRCKQKCWRDPEVREANRNAGGALQEELTTGRTEEICESLEIPEKVPGREGNGFSPKMELKGP